MNIFVGLLTEEEKVDKDILIEYIEKIKKENFEKVKKYVELLSLVSKVRILHDKNFYDVENVYWVSDDECSCWCNDLAIDEYGDIFVFHGNKGQVNLIKVDDQYIEEILFYMYENLSMSDSCNCDFKSSRKRKILKI